MNEFQRYFLNKIFRKYDTIKLRYDAFLDVFTINMICDVLEINRNRYNYLVRTSQLKDEIYRFLKYYEVSDDE